MQPPRIFEFNPAARLPVKLVKVLAVSLLVGLAACSSGDDDNDGQNSRKSITLDMQIPNSLTGALTADSSMPIALQANAQGVGMPCTFAGVDDEDDPFRNGYEMTKFMVSAVATWTCITDTLIDIADSIPHDGSVHAADNQTDNDNYEADEPTHYSVTDDSDTQTTVRLYYGYDRDVPPLPSQDPQFYISWNKAANGNVEGRLVIDGTRIDPEHRDIEDPTLMRLDFSYTDAEKLANMYLRFDEGNEWADGFRIEVRKDLTASALEQVFTARGLMNMKAQFLPVADIDELPVLQMFTVSNRLGDGAAVAEFEDVSLPLDLNADTGNHLGNYLFDKTDKYFFDADQGSNEPWDWIHKSFSFAEYRGGRTTPLTGGTGEDPFDPSLDQIVTFLGLPDTYFTANECNVVGDSCVELLNAVFENDFAGQEPNQGADPADWRSSAIANPDYLGSVFPNGSDWSGAFDFGFTPSANNGQ